MIRYMVMLGNIWSHKGRKALRSKLMSFSKKKKKKILEFQFESIIYKFLYKNNFVAFTVL